MKSMLILICILFSLFIQAQQKPLSVGDKLPTEIVQSLKISNRKPEISNSLIILDFFATWCTACIKELPKLESLQQKFKDHLLVVIVTAESPEKLEGLRKKNKLFANCQLQVIANDTILKKLFPHKYIPHEVWINEQGKVLAITDAIEVNETNIQLALAGKKLELPTKIDALDFEYSKPLLQNNNGGTKQNRLYQSLLTNHLPGINKSSGVTRDSLTTRYYFINNSILTLYEAALGFEANRVILEVKDTARYILPLEPTGEWLQNNLYSYEITIPKSSLKQTMQQLMLQDLDRYFGLHGRIEKRKITCWAIQRVNPIDTSLKTKGAKPRITINDTTGSTCFNNQPVPRLLTALNAQHSPQPGKPIFIDETGISFNIDIELPQTAVSDIAMLRKALSAYGLQLVEVQRELDMFILTENDHSTTRSKL